MGCSEKVGLGRLSPSPHPTQAICSPSISSPGAKGRQPQPPLGSRKASLAWSAVNRGRCRTELPQRSCRGKFQRAQILVSETKKSEFEVSLIISVVLEQVCQQISGSFHFDLFVADGISSAAWLHGEEMS